MTITIAVVNQSTLLSNAAITASLPKLQIQIDRDFKPVWGVGATLTFPSGVPASTDWQLVILDDYASANELGYHEMTLSGMPIGYVFMDNAINNSIPWTVVASHEILEMIIDPATNLSVLTESSPYQQPGETWLYAYEICDPVQDVSLAYSIDGYMVSDFVYPSWFQSFWSPFGTQFNYQNTIFFPFQLQSGGFIAVNLIESNDGWQELYGYSLKKIKDQDDKELNPEERRRKRMKKRKHRRLLKSTQRRRSLR